MAKTVDPALTQQLRRESEQTKDDDYPAGATGRRPNRQKVCSAQRRRGGRSPTGRRQQTPTPINARPILDPRTTGQRTLRLTLPHSAVKGPGSLTRQRPALGLVGHQAQPAARCLAWPSGGGGCTWGPGVGAPRRCCQGSSAGAFELPPDHRGTRLRFHGQMDTHREVTYFQNLGGCHTTRDASTRNPGLRVRARTFILSLEDERPAAQRNPVLRLAPPGRS